MRKLFTRFLRFLLLSVMMVFSTGVYAQTETQSTVELFASSVDKCYNATNSYTSTISVKDFIKMKSFKLTLNYDKSEFAIDPLDALANVNPLLLGGVTANVITTNPTLGIVEFTWTSATEVTIGNNVVGGVPLFDVKFKVANFPNNTGDNLFDSPLTWDVVKSTYYYVASGYDTTINPTLGGSYQVETTRFNNGTLNVPVSYTAANFAYTVTPATCAGGTAVITVTSPVGTGMKYYFNGSITASTSPVADAQAPSVNTVRVEDANGCFSHLFTINVTAPNPLTVNGVTTENPLCFGGQGEIQFDISGGSAPYTYWVVPAANGSTVEADLNTKQLSDPVFAAYKFTNFQVLKPAGTYYVAVNDANGCIDLRDDSKWITVTIAPVTSQITSTPTVTNVTCNGSTNGAIAVTGIAGGTGSAYTVSKDGIVWFPAVAGAYTFNNLGAAVYPIQIKDINGCTVTTNVEVKQPAAMAFAPTYTDASCAGGATGTISVATVTGGTGPYTFAVATAGTAMPVDPLVWATAGPGTISNLVAGYYSVWVKDANGCVKAFSNLDGSGNVLPIQAPGALSFTTNADNDAAIEVSCNGTDFTLTAQGVGGTVTTALPYTYSFNGSVYSATNTFVVAAPVADVLVTVAVKDANGCIATRVVTVDVPVALTIFSFADPLPPTCSLGTDGRITVNAVGGVTPYQYSTNNATWFSNKVLALPEGATTVYVKDAKGCTISGVVTIPTLTVSAFNAAPTAKIACFGNATTEGVAITGLTWQAGRKIQYLFSSSAATVYTTGTAFVPASVNGVAPTAPAVSTKFGVGTYFVGARDEYGCTSAVKEVKFEQNPALVLASVTSINATCAGAIDGSLTINTTGGNGIPSYAIVNNFIAIGNLTGADFQPIETYDATTKVGKQIVQTLKGTYYVVLRDVCNTTNLLYSGPFIVDGYKPIALAANPIAKTNITCNNANDGTITVSGVSGGKPEFDGAGLYTYKLFTNADVLKATNTTGKFTALAAGFYYVTVTDASNCPLAKTATVEIVNPAVLTITNVAVTHFTCVSSNDGIVAVTAAGGTGAYWLAVNASVNGLGTDIKAADWIAFPAASTTKPYIATEAGVYTFYVKDVNGCVAVAAPVTVLAPKVLTPVVAVNTPVTCPGGTDGSVDVNATGGFETTTPAFTHTYSYSLTSNFAVSNTTGIFPNLAPGTHTVYVKATNTPAVVTAGIVTYTYPAVACTYPLTFVVAAPVEYSYRGQVLNTVSCRGGNDGKFAVTVISGGTPFTGGEYDVQLTTTDNPTLDAAKWIRTTSKVATFSDLPHAIYSVWIKDANGCLLPTGAEVLPTPVPVDYVWHKVASWEVQQPGTFLTASAVWNKDVTCFGGSDGKFTVTAVGGTGPYKYAAKISVLPLHVFAPDPASTDWKDNAGVFENMGVGTWIIWVMDDNGCVVGGEGPGVPVDEWRVQVRQPLKVEFALAATEPSCFGTATGKITASSLVGNAYQLSALGAPYSISVVGTDAAGVAVNIVKTGLAFDAVIATGVPASVTKPVLAAKTNAYTVTVTDKNGCSTVKTIQVWQNTAVTAEIVKANGAFVCPGDNSGVIEAVATGGTGTYLYQLKRNGDVYTAWQPIPSFIVQVGYTWKIEVKDANGCMASDEEILNAPIGVTADFLETTCFSDTKASVILHATGEAGRTFSVRYRLNTVTTFGDWINFTNDLPIGNLVFANATPTENFYYFEIKDDQGCTYTVSKSFVPTQHPLEVIAVQSADQLTASFSISGGISPYSYKVGTGALVNLPADGNSVQVIELTAPETSVIVYDAHGCFVTKKFVVAPISVTAVPNAGDAMKNTFDVVLTFNRAVTVAAGDITGGTFTPGTATTFTVAMTGADMADLTLTLGTGIKDAAANAFVGATFTYKVGDNVAPTLVTKTPVAATVLTDTHPTFKMTFSEAVKLGAGGNLVVYKVGTTTPALTVPITAAMITGSDVTATYTSVSSLARSTDYYVLVDGLALTDLAGNPFAGVIGETAWTFKTGASWPTDTETELNIAEFKVYPNPFVGYVDVESSVKLSKVVITNIAGQTVKEVVNPSQRILVNELRSGIYFISLYDMDNVVAKTAKIVKR